MPRCRNMIADTVGRLLRVFIRWQQRNDYPHGKHWLKE